MKVLTGNAVRLSGWALTLALVVALASCGEDEDKAAPPARKPESGENTDEPENPTAAAITWSVGRSSDEDYWLEGDYLVHASSIGDGVPIVIVGEGFDHEELRKGGYWEQIATIMGNQFLNNEVTRDLRAYYDVYLLMSESALSNTGVTGNGNLGSGKSRFEQDNFGMADDAIREYIPLGERHSLRRMIYICNGAIGGWAFGDDMGCFSTETDWPQEAGKVNTVDLTQEPTIYWMMHEFAGHAFGSLADEYYQEDVIPGDWGHWNFEGLNRSATDGNSSFWATEDPGHAAPWAPFIGLDGYEMVGYFGSGGNLLCESTSIMFGDIRFHYNAISRYALWAGTMVKAGVNPMEYYLDIANYEGVKFNAFPSERGLAEFLSYDTVNYDAKREPLTGTVTVSQEETVLTANASLSGSEDVIYTWQRAESASGPWKSIIGAAGLTKDPSVTDDGDVYYIQAEDAGKYLRVRTSKTSLRGYVDSAPVGPVEAYPALSGTVAITGSLAVGNTVGVDTSSLSGAGELLYAWHCGFSDDPMTFLPAQKEVDGRYECETSPTITLKKTDKFQTNASGRYIRVLVRRKGCTGYVKSAIAAVP